MKFLRKILPAGLVLAVAGSLLFGLNGVANAAACRFQYTSDNMQTSQTPVFNSICGVPTLFNSTDGQYAFGDETDFVRIRPNTAPAHDDTSNKNNPKLVGGTLTSACTDGSRYDVLTYIHNDASPDFNNNGSGSAVAHNVKLAMDASGIGTTSDQFKFTSTITADAPAIGASDSAVLDCNGHQVKLTLVSGSVHYNTSFDTSTTWGPAGDSAVNGTTTIGSPSWGSGNQWGCWDYLTAVVYQVQVSEIPQQQPSTLQCVMDSFDVNNETHRASLAVHAAATNGATVTSYSANWGDSSQPSVKDSGDLSSFSADHTYGSDVKTADVVVTLKGKLANGNDVTDSTNCVGHVNFTSTPPQTPPSTPPSSLPNTGAGSVLGLFAGVSAASAALYRRFLSRRLADR